MKKILDAIEYCQNLDRKVKLTFDDIAIPEFAAIVRQENLTITNPDAEIYLHAIWQVDKNIRVELWSEQLTNIK